MDVSEAETIAIWRSCSAKQKPFLHTTRTVTKGFQQWMAEEDLPKGLDTNIFTGSPRIPWWAKGKVPTLYNHKSDTKSTHCDKLTDRNVSNFSLYAVELLGLELGELYITANHGFEPGKYKKDDSRFRAERASKRKRHLVRHATQIWQWSFCATPPLYLHYLPAYMARTAARPSPHPVYLPLGLRGWRLSGLLTITVGKLVDIRRARILLVFPKKLFLQI